MDVATVVFLLVLFGAYTAGTVLGFGTTILAVTFGAQLVPMDVLLPIVAPLNLGLGVYIVVRHRAHIRWRLLLWRFLPLAALGVPLGLFLFNLRRVEWLRLGFGVLVFGLAALQLWAARRAREPGPLARLERAGMLLGGGFVHGLYGTGGPMIVYVVGREIEDKGEFRSTLSMLFLPLSIVLLADYAAVGLFTTKVASLGLASVAPMLLGMWLGERAHDRFDNARFKLAVWWLLLGGGLVLSLRALAALA